LREQAGGETEGDGATDPQPGPPTAHASGSRAGAEVAGHAEDGGWAGIGARAEGAEWHENGASAWSPESAGSRACAGRREPTEFRVPPWGAEPTMTGGHGQRAHAALTSGRAGFGTGGSAGSTERALIGDELRIPVAWCELSPCISYHSDPAALGEA